MKPIQEGSMQSKESESFGGTETGALFPRLHVKETKVSGLRAPPRNKMALFEQFTIPPHRFVPPPVQRPSQSCPGVAAFYVAQGPLYDGRYTCNPCYFNQTVAYNSQHQMAGQSIVTQPMLASSSSGSGLSSCDKEKHEAPSGSSIVRTRACSSAVTSNVTLALSINKDGNRSLSKIVKDPALARSQKKDPCHASVSQSGADSDFYRFHSSTNPQYSQSNIDCRHWSVTHSYKDKALIPCTLSVEAKKASLGVSSTQADTGVENLENRSPDVPDDGKVQDDRSFMFATKGNDGSALESASIEGQVSIDLPVESCSHKYQTTVDLIDLPQEKHSNINDNEHGMLKKRAGSDGLENDRFTDQKVELNVSFSYFSVKTSERASSANVIRTEETANGSLSNQLENKSCDIHMRPPSNSSGEASEYSEPKDCSSPDQDSDAIVKSSHLMPKFIPKDVISVLGQREFWKARKAIILQQKTFSGQVYELHRLIKVQQLIATMPGLLIVEDSECALLSSNIYETVPGEVCKDLGGSASAQLEEKTPMKDKPFNVQPPENSSKEQPSHPRDSNAHFQQCSEPHRQSDPTGAPYTKCFQSTLGTWDYPVASPTKNHWQKAVGGKPGSCLYEAYLGAFSHPQVLNYDYGMVNGSLGNGTAHATLLSPVTPGIPAGEIGWTDNPFIGPDQVMNPAVLSEDVSAFKDISHFSAEKPCSAALGSGVVPRSEWPRPVFGKSSLPSKDNPSIKKSQWLDNIPGGRQPPETKKQRFQTVESTPALCGSEKMGLQSDCRVLCESNAEQNGVRHANNMLTSTNLTQDYGSSKIGHTVEAESVFCHKGNCRDNGSGALSLFPLAPVLSSGKGSDKPSKSDNLQVSKVIKAVPRSAVAASESTAIILKSIQRERWQQG